MRVILAALLLLGVGASRSFGQNTPQTQRYIGEYSGAPIAAEIDWRGDNTLVGTFRADNSTTTYRISGTNFVEGQIEVIVLRDGRRQGSGTLYKRIQNGLLIWSGSIETVDGGSSNLSFYRARTAAPVTPAPTRSKTPSSPPRTSGESARDRCARIAGATNYARFEALSRQAALAGRQIEIFAACMNGGYP